MRDFAPTVCRDNFFEDPHKIIELSKQIDFKPTKYISGYRSDYLDKIDIDLYKYNPGYYYDIEKLFSSFITREPLEVYNMLYQQLINEDSEEDEQVNIFNNLFLPSYNNKGPYDIAEIIQLCGIKK